MFEKTNVEHRISSAYHPQTNGLDERTNQTLVHSLTKLITTQDEWDLSIDAALYAYRIGTQDSSRFSPFFLLYNRHPRKAIDHELNTAVNQTNQQNDANKANTTIKETMEELLDMREQYQQKAHENIRRAQERQKTYFDAKHDSNHVSI